MADARTSVTHPIEVAWLPLPWPGKVGLTFAPGKKDSLSLDGGWDRDLQADVSRLRETYGTKHLVSLIEDQEFDLLHIAELRATAVASGIALHRLPIVDVSVPTSDAAVCDLVFSITVWAANGETVVIHCRGGLGRAGTIGGCVLRAAGFNADAALAALTAARGPNCPETQDQRDYVRAFVGVPLLALRISPGTLRAALAMYRRVSGAVLGAAIGDALGHPTEFYSYEQLEGKYGSGGVKGFELWWEGDDGKRFAPYTDDTQMAEIVLQAIVDHGTTEVSFESAMEGMAAGFGHWHDSPQGGHRAPGTTCLAGAKRLAAGVPWREAGDPHGGGCGSVMRAYPFGLLLGFDLERAERWAVEHSRMTHQAPMALAACAAMAVGIAWEMAAAAPSSTLWAMVEAAKRHDPATGSMAEHALHDAYQGADARRVLTELQGWNAREAIAAAMFVVARHPRDIRAALLEAANASGDSDSIATLVGALLGARLGVGALPEEWVRDVERSQELLSLAGMAAQIAVA
jgi:ADP-ribosylglycohydrolase/protein-tyrosine phosphatase